MTDLYLRKVLVTVGEEGSQGRSWGELRTTFDGEHTAKRSTNKATVSLYNLSQDSREFIRKGMKLILEAGYIEDSGILFMGDVVHLTHERTAGEWVTTMECGDGSKAISKATIQATLPKGATPSQILSTVKGSLKGLKIGEGFIESLVDISSKSQGVALSGSAADELDQLFRGTDYQWSIQDGEVQVLKEGQASPREAVVISPKTGLVGSPKLLEGGNLEVVSLLIHQSRPGRLVRLESSQYNGNYTVLKSKFNGDSHSGSWTTTMELKAI